MALSIAEEIRQAGAEVDVEPVEGIKDLSGCDGMVIGTAVRATQILSKTKRFLLRNRKQLLTLPLAYFIVCLMLKEETLESIAKDKQFAKPLLKLKNPISPGSFGGCFEPAKLSPPLARVMKNIPTDDYQNWDKLRSWARETTPQLLGEG